MIDTRSAVARFRTLESLAVMPRVSSTNLIARRIVAGCVANQLSMPQAMIVAREQFAGRGRNDRSWSSPAGKGIYATTLLTRSVRELALFPLEMANIIAAFLRDSYAIDARVKWPNDVIAAGRKIAGILIEARVQGERAYLIIGTGINVAPAEGDDRPNAISIEELSPAGFDGLEAATVAFARFVDDRFSSPLLRDRVLAEWRAHTVHCAGDRITCVLSDRTVSGEWDGIDDEGRALLRTGDALIAVSAGEIIA